jgi:hypothetical protein
LAGALVAIVMQTSDKRLSSSYKARCEVFMREEKQHDE